jgi:hypothetical protein
MVVVSERRRKRTVPAIRAGSRVATDPALLREQELID